MSYLVAAYVVVLVTLSAYALRLHLRCQRLRGEK
jgi:hypothetical protein